MRPAAGLAALPAAAESWQLRFACGDVMETGVVHLPPGAAPAGGWPVVTYGHMTTGGSNGSAPSRAGLDHRERRRMTQGDAYVSHLLDHGVAVLQPDYRGLGSPGPHPYLLGEPLGASVQSMLTAARDHFDLGSRWVSAGHSEGSMAAMYAAATAPTGVELRGVCAFTPVTRMDTTIGWSLRLPVVLPGFAVVSALIALMIQGASTADDRLGDLVASDGLSPAARSCWPHLSQRCLTELCADDSFGAIAPRALLGPRGDEVRTRLLASFRSNDVAGLHLPPAVPLRIDAGRLDEVAPPWLTRKLADAHRRRGTEITLRWWTAMHSATVDRAAAEAAQWTLARLGVSA